MQLIDLRSLDGMKVWGHDVEGQLEAKKVFQVALGATNVTCILLNDDDDMLLNFNTLQELTAEEDLFTDARSQNSQEPQCRNE